MYFIGPLPRPPHFNDPEVNHQREQREEWFNYNNEEHYNYDYEEDDEEEMYFGKDSPISCIGVRKHCLQDTVCAGHLVEYRRLCRENKKKGECVTVQM